MTHRTFTRTRTWGWTAAALGLALSPMLLDVIGPQQPRRPSLVESGVWLGFLAIGLVALQFVTTAVLVLLAALFAVVRT
jgi:hypothetical protein